MIFVVEIRDRNGAVASREYEKRCMSDALNAARFDLANHPNCSVWSVSVKGPDQQDR